MASEPTTSTADDAVAGRPCPYCQTAIAAGDEATTCGDCGAVHHSDCWQENTGCAVPGCESAPDPAAVATTPPPAEAPTGGRLSIEFDGDAPGGVRATRQAPAGAPVGLPERRGNRGILVVSAVLGVLVLLGLIAVLSGGGAETVARPGGSAPAVEPDAQIARPGGSSSSKQSSGRGASDEPAGTVYNPSLGACATQSQVAESPTLSGRPRAASQAVRAQLARVTTSYLAAIKQGDREEAFACVSPAAQGAFLENGDVGTREPNWWRLQDRLRDGLAGRPQVEVSRAEWLTSSSVRFLADASGGWEGDGEAPIGWLWARVTLAEGSTARRSWALEPALPACGERAVSRMTSVRRADATAENFYASDERC